jgi:hypothetical protein
MSVDGWGAMLQAGRSRVKSPDEVTEFLNSPNPSSRTMVLEFTQPLTEMSKSKNKALIVTGHGDL